MLISFTIENFRSFKEEATLSLVASNGKEMRDSHVFTPELKNGVKSFDLLRSAVVYGPNAGGKSNFFNALSMMKWIVGNSIKGYEFLPIIPFVLNKKTAKEPSTFDVVMVIDGVRYQYGFSATKDKIYAEWLFAFPKGRTQTWFERDYNKKTKKYDYTFGDALKGQKEVWRESTRTNALFLSTAVQLNSEKLQPIYDCFKKNLLLVDADDIPVYFSLAHCKEHGSEKIVNFLKAADFAIEDIKVGKLESPLKDTDSKTSDSLLSNKINKENQLNAKTRHKTEDGKYIDMPLSMESDGTQRMLALSILLLGTIEHGHVLLIDELNQRLHPALIRYIIELFNNPKTNPNNAQLIFTTHDVSLLKQDIFRRDQIWFCERDVSQASTLFPLTDFKPRKGFEDFEAYYMTGRYGALPIIGDFSTTLKSDEDK